MMSSNIPKQVQDAADEAERLEKALNPDTPPDEDPNAPAAGALEPSVSQPPAQPVQAVEPIKPEEDWRQRYLSLQGMFNAEVPRLNTQLKDQAAQIAQLQAAAQAQPSAPSAQPQPPQVKLVTDKDVEVFGGDLIDLIKRQSGDIFKTERAQMNADMGKLQAENAELKKQLGGVVEKQGVSLRQAYLNDLAKQVPDYETLNVDPELLKWMAETDPLSGLPRQAYLNNAWEQHDAVRTANLFKAFQATRVAQPQPLSAPQAPNPAETPAQSAQAELARQVAPGTQRSSAPPVGEGASTRIWSQAEIARFYTDVTKGVYAAKPKELQRIETEIDQAVATGRVR